MTREAFQSNRARATTTELEKSNGPVSVERKGSITIVRMHTEGSTQPAHAITRGIWEGLYSSFSDISQDSQTRVVILRGAKRIFGLGANFDELSKVLEEDKRNSNNKAATEYWTLVNYAHTAIETCPKPVIAVLEKFSLGAAFALALACHFRITDAKAQLGIPAVQRGLTLGIRDTQRLVAKVGSARAIEMLTLGKIYTPDEMLQWGLVNIVAESGKVEEEVDKLSGLLLKNAPLAMEEALSNVDAAAKNPGLAGHDDASRRIRWAQSEDLEEGIRAFNEDRDANFKGR